MGFVVLGLGVIACTLSAFGVDALGPVDVFQLGVAISFGSFLIPPRRWGWTPTP